MFFVELITTLDGICFPRLVRLKKNFCSKCRSGKLPHLRADYVLVRFKCFFSEATGVIFSLTHLFEMVPKGAMAFLSRFSARFCGEFLGAAL